MNSYVIDHENSLPFGMLNNNFNFPLKINEQKWSNCSQYIYVNCIQHVLNHNTYFHNRQDKYIDQMMKSPTYETYYELLETISNDIRYNFYYKEVLSKIVAEKNFDDFIMKNTWDNKDEVLKDVLNSLKNSLTIKQYYNYFPSYIVIKIISQFLIDELEDFSKIQLYLQIIESKKNINIIHDIIKDYNFSKTQKLPIYDFEFEIEGNKELLKVLELSHCYPNILFIYAFKYHLREFKTRMDNKYKNKILELFLKYKNKYTESIKKEIYLVNNNKLKDIILEQVLNFDEKFRKYTEKDAPLRQIMNSKVSEDKILEYESFNFYEIEDNKIKINKFQDNNNEKNMTNNFMSFIQNLNAKSSNLPENLERIKEVLTTMAIHKKFNIMLPQHQIENYGNHLPEFLKNHALNFTNSSSNEEDRITDFQFALYFTRGLSLVYQTEDLTLAKFVGPLLTKLSMTIKSTEAFNIYKEKGNIKTLFQEDLFMELWMKKQLQYLSHFISCITLFLDVNDISVTTEVISQVLELFSDNKHFYKLKTTYDDLPVNFCELFEYYFSSTSDIIEKKSFTVLIWNFVTYNIQNIFKTRDVYKTKSFIVKYILRLRQFHQCVENSENNDIACYTFAIINVANKFEKLCKLFKIESKINTEKYVEAVLLNEKTIDTDVSITNPSGDIVAIVNQIFSQNETVIKSALSQKQIVDLIDRIKDEEEKFKINIWVSLNF